MRILVVEDDRIMAGYIQQGLVDQGYTVDVAHDGEKGQELAESTGYDLIILDILLPGKSGIDLCRDLRKKRVDSRIVMLTCRDTLDDKIQGLDSGADDYVTKPFEFPELFARVRALLRRNPAGGSTILRVGEVTLNTLTREVKRREDAVKLTVREYAVLEYLMRHPGVVLTRGMIEDHVWNTSLFTPGSNLIDVHIGRLRTKLGDTEGALIEAVRGIGYRIKADG